MTEKSGLRPSQVEADYGIPTSSLAKLRMTGEGPPFAKVGRRVIYLRADIERWLAIRRRISTSATGAQVVESAMSTRRKGEVVP